MPQAMRSLSEWLARWSRLIFLAIYLASGWNIARGTVVGSELDKCPLCGKRYVGNVLAAYDSFTSPDGPPVFISTCPYCLFSWKGDMPEKLSDVEKKRIRSAMMVGVERISPRIKKELADELSDPYFVRHVDDRDFQTYLAGVCMAAKTGRRTWPEPEIHSVSRPEPATELKEDRKLERLLPAILAAQRSRQALPVLNLADESHLEKVGREQLERIRRHNAYSVASRLIRRGNVEALEFVLRQMLASTQSDVKDDAWEFDGAMTAMATKSALRWPGLDLHLARLPIVGDTLTYLHAGDVLPASLIEALPHLRKSSDEFDARLALVAASLRRDRGMAAILDVQLRRNSYIAGYSCVSKYFQAAGTRGDLSLLELRAVNACPDSRVSARFPAAMDRQEVEKAMMKIRARDLLGQKG